MDDSGGTKIRAKVEKRIINFFNNVQRPSDITANVNSIDPDLAKNILKKREEIGVFGFRGLDQLANIIPPDNFGGLVSNFGPEKYGEWNILYDVQLPDGTPTSVAHAALLHTGLILFLQEAYWDERWMDPCNGTATYYSGRTFLWDPADEVTPRFEFTLNQPTMPGHHPLGCSLFCSGHSFLSNGQLLVAGGCHTDWDWIQYAFRFDPDTRHWQKTTGDMAYKRWYPTLVTLGNEKRVLVVGGRGAGVEIDIATTPAQSKIEIYDELTDTFSQVNMQIERNFPQLYPGLHTLSGGEIFYSRTGWGEAPENNSVLDLTTDVAYLKFIGNTGQWISLQEKPQFHHREKGMSVLLVDPCATSAKVMIIGGVTGGNTSEIIRLSSLSPSWETPTFIPGEVHRENVNAVLLPDGTVFVCGGTNSANDPCALYDPEKASWSIMDNMHYRKQYHSFAILLPNCKVMATGGAKSSCRNGSRAIEVFSPPYLFRGHQPVIDNSPGTIHYGDRFSVQTQQSAAIRKVVLVRPMAVTHQTDTEQRVIQMNFTSSGNQLNVTAPMIEKRYLVPLGYYMLFIVDDRGVPSKAKFLLIKE